MLSVPQETANQALLQAAFYADLELFEMALECGADVYSPQPGSIELGIVALQRVLEASRNKTDISAHIAIAKHLLSQQIDLNKQIRPNESSPHLSTALTCGHPELVHLLIENGATVWNRGGAGGDLMHWAANSGMTWFVSRVLKEISPPNPGPDKEMSYGLRNALCGAVQGGYLEIVEMLLDFGVDIESKYIFGSTPLMLAAGNGHHAIVQLLRERNADILAVEERGETVLLGAAKGGLLSLVSELLEKGSDPQASDYINRTALHFVTGPDREEIAGKLLAAGASPLARTLSNVTVLHKAASKGDLKLAKACLDAGEEADTSDDWGRTPFIEAARNGEVEMMALLAQHGANPEHIAHYEHDNALHRAIHGHHEAATAWLLNRKVKLDDVMECLYFGEKTPLMLAAHLGQVDTIKMLLDAGADINFKTFDSYTATHCLASEHCHPSALDSYALFEQAGALINERSCDGITPLENAAYWGCLELAIQLIEDGADVNNVSVNGATPLHSAAERGHHLLVQTLLKRGANPNLVNRNGKTPLDLALSTGQLRVIKIFQEHATSPE
ncbi:hypothetical protein EON80_07930 [bacterium]|nr:MAG: hypothetical protein EON80_07930 [bacterium]